jgi:hypothetical protein
LPIAGDHEGASAPRGGEAPEGGSAAAVARAEAAVLAILRGEPVADAAPRHGLDPAELERLVASFRAAGRVALEAALEPVVRGRAPDQGP